MQCCAASNISTMAIIWLVNMVAKADVASARKAQGVQATEAPVKVVTSEKPSSREERLSALALTILNPAALTMLALALTMLVLAQTMPKSAVPTMVVLALRTLGLMLTVVTSVLIALVLTAQVQTVALLLLWVFPCN
jgi:hypothetical protein